MTTGLGLAIPRESPEWEGIESRGREGFVEISIVPAAYFWGCILWGTLV